jgi:hypothetical protein
MMSTPCLDAQQACVLDCTMQLNECMVGPPGKDNGCQSDFDDCKATCQSTCVTCVACPAGASACLFP